jgi:RNA polymerase sigma-70 factor (ECF subfamily)
MSFEDKKIDLKLIHQAQAGCKESLALLSERIRDDLQAYLYRLTLDTHLTEDLTQETLMEVVKHLATLHLPNTRAFWAWLYKVAFSKVCHQARKSNTGSIPNESRFDETQNTPVQQLMRQELAQAIYKAMTSLTFNHRNVITLRCFDQLSYREISNITGNTQMQAKLQFFRAKKALGRCLRKSGFKESHLLPALGIFAALTHKSASAKPIEAASVTVGLGTTLIGAAVSKLGVTAAVAGISLSLLAGHQPLRERLSSLSIEAEQQQLTHITKDTNYLYPASITDAYDPDGNGWTSWHTQSRRERPQSTRVVEILVHERNLPGRCLLLPENHWVQVHFPIPIADGPGVDLFLTGYGLANKPRVALIGPQGEQQDLIPTLTKDAPSDFTTIAYDLAETSLSFSPRDVRITGAATETNTRPFALRMIRVSSLGQNYQEATQGGTGEPTTKDSLVQ